jgi:hypothetical protein
MLGERLECGNALHGQVFPHLFPRFAVGDVLIRFLPSTQHPVDFLIEQLPCVRSTALWTETVIAQDVGLGSAPIRIALEVKLLLHLRIVPR